MKTEGNKVLVTTDILLHDHVDIGATKVYVGGMEDYQFNATNNGTITATNDAMRSLGLVEGVKVYAHHHCFVHRDSDSSFRNAGVSIGGKFHYEVDTDPEEEIMYGFVDSEGFHPWGKYLFLEPYMREVKTVGSISIEGDQGLVYEGYTGTVVHISEDSIKHTGLKQGDVVRVRKDADFLVDIEGRKLFRVTWDDVLWKE